MRLVSAWQYSKTKASLKIVRYVDRANVRWDEFVANSHSGTFLHTRRYLSYHRDRYKDVSLFLEDDDGQVIGVMPAALDPRNDQRVVSHPGITYGGLLHAGKLKGERMVRSFNAVCEHYAAAGYESLAYKAVPYIYHHPPCFDDLYALFRLGANRYRCDLSCVIDLQYRGPLSTRRARALQKARKYNLTIHEGVEMADRFWPILEENLLRKHNLKPVHTLDEILLLHSRFPMNISFVLASIKDQAVAGVSLYETDVVSHAQYIGSSLKGYECAALDAVLDHCISRAQSRGLRYFDFGVSTVEDGRVLNSGLHDFKAEFGGGGVVHEFFELNLKLFAKQ